MRVAIAAVRTGAVAPAARDDAAGRFGVGDAVGFVDDELVAWGATAPTLEAVLAALAADAELVTCIAGEGAPLDGEAIAALAPVGVELELEDGGQPSYWWLLERRVAPALGLPRGVCGAARRLLPHRAEGRRGARPARAAPSVVERVLQGDACRPSLLTCGARSHTSQAVFGSRPRRRTTARGRAARVRFPR